MKKNEFANLIADSKKALIKHQPEILTCIGVVGMVGAAVLAVKATPKALKIMEEEKKDISTKLDVVKKTYKCYIPPALLAVLSAVCIFGANSIHIKRGTALATAYRISENARKEYKDKVIETIGEKKEKAITDKIAKEHIEKNPVQNNYIIETGKGSSLCYDFVSGRYFRSDIENIKKNLNVLNKQMLEDSYVSLNDFYYLLDLPHIGIGDLLGWHVDYGLVEIDFSSQIAFDGEPCLVIDYNIYPGYDYDEMIM